MASPWKHPATGVFYLRRQIPERLRAAFDGKALFKASLGTKIASEATITMSARGMREQAMKERASAATATLPLVRARALTAAETWDRMADVAERTAAGRKQPATA